jgi:hypothetical protein
MPKQRELDFGADGLAALWTRIPESARREAVALWSRLLAGAARATGGTVAQSRATTNTTNPTSHEISVRQTDQELATTHSRPADIVNSTSHEISVRRTDGGLVVTGYRPESVVNSISDQTPVRRTEPALTATGSRTSNIVN